jgi:hypothetical protein
VKGAGIVAVGVGAKCSLTACKVVLNTAGAAITLDGGSIEATVTQFCESSAGAGVLAAGRGTVATLEKSTSIGNSLGGVLVYESAAAELQRCTSAYSKGYGIEVQV